MNNMNMNINIFLIILIISILCYNNLEKFIETATYLGKVIIREDVKCEKDVNVKGAVNANQLCIDDTCINKSKLRFIKQLPLKLKTAVCIGNTCVGESSFKVIKKLTEIKNQSVLDFKVVSSGRVMSQLTGVAEFYVNNNPITNITIGRGFNIMVINENGSFNDFRVFNTGGDKNARQAMIEYIKNIDYGLFVMVAVYDDAAELVSPTVYEALKLVGGRGTISPNYRGSYALIGRRGMKPGSAKEEAKNSSANYNTHHTVTIENTIKSSDLYVKLTE